MTYVYDLEIYKNYMCAGFMSSTGNRVKLFEAFNRAFTHIEIKRIKRLKFYGTNHEDSNPSFQECNALLCPELFRCKNSRLSNENLRTAKFI